MPYNYYNCDSCVPSVDFKRIREDFSCIFDANAIEVELIKHRTDLDVAEDADFFGTRTPEKIYRKVVKMFITAESSDASKRTQSGITTDDSLFKAFAMFDTPLENNDVVKFVRTTKIADFDIRKDTLFIIKNHNKPFYAGQYCFQEFNLQRVDKERNPL